MSRTPRVVVIGYGDWTGPASATLIGVEAVRRGRGAGGGGPGRLIRAVADLVD